MADACFKCKYEKYVHEVEDFKCVNPQSENYEEYTYYCESCNCFEKRDDEE